MKKLNLLLTLFLSVSLTACSSGNKPTENSDSLKTGIALDTRLDESDDSSAKFNIHISSVTVDEKNKVVACAIDGINTEIRFDENGRILTSTDSEIKTKNDLGNDYGLASVSSIGKEWNEQAEFFAKSCIAKTAEEIEGISSSDIKAGCTISIDPFAMVVSGAVENAKESSASFSDKIGIGVVAKTSSSTDATVENDGKAALSLTVCGLTVNESGIITGCVFDCVDAEAYFSLDGKITSLTNVPVSSKNDLGANYGLSSASSIGREWNEQAASFGEYCIGKGIDEVINLPTANGVLTDSDISSSVTINVSDFLKALAKAYENAK